MPTTQTRKHRWVDIEFMLLKVIKLKYHANKTEGPKILIPNVMEMLLLCNR